MLSQRHQQDLDEQLHRSLLQKANATRTPMVNSRAPIVAAVFVSMGRLPVSQRGEESALKSDIDESRSLED